LDFIFTLSENNIINKNFYLSSSIKLPIRNYTLNELIESNKTMLVNYKEVNDIIYYYGIVLDKELLEQIAEAIKADVFLLLDWKPIETSSSDNRYYSVIEEAVNALKYKNNFDLFSQELNEFDFLTSIYTPGNDLTPGGKLGFAVYTFEKAAAEFRSTMRFMIIIILSVGFALALILVLLFTAKFRKQITFLTNAAELTAKGELNHNAEVITKDEIGNLAVSFNNMINKIREKEREEKEYTEFVSLLNRNPLLNQISKASLNKITDSLGVTFSLLYIVEEGEQRLVSSHGLSKNDAEIPKDISIYKSVISSKKESELFFDENHPVIKTGMVDIKICYLLVYPIIYNEKVIAILEIASEKKPKEDVKNYLRKIDEQLAIGLSNAEALEKLEKLVLQLRDLNNEYIKQNYEISDKNRQLMELHEELKEKAKELEAQKEKAVELAQVKSQFLASMSHELRTPLNSILGLSELVLKDSASTDKTRERLSVVIKNGSKLLNLINNILEFSKLESGKVELNKSEFSLKAFTNDILSFIEPLLFDKQLSLKIKYNFDSDLIIYSDRSKVEQIALNLIGNSIKFTEFGEIKLSYEKNENDLRIRVADTGIGISEADKEKIFEEFRQIDAANSRKYGGTGLGLAIIKRYLNIMQGEISLNSNVGKGTEFIVDLPGVIIKHVKKFDGKTEQSFVINDTTPKVLLVNHSFQSQKLISEYLNSNGIAAKSCKLDLDVKTDFIEDVADYNILIVDYSDSRDFGEVIFQAAMNQNIEIIVTHFNEEIKKGFAFTFDYIIKELTEDFFDNYPDLYNYLEGKRIGYFTDYKHKHGYLPENANNKNLNSINNISYNPDLFIIDITGTKFNPVKVYVGLKKSKLYKNVPTVLEISEKLTDKQLKLIGESIESIVANEGLHPLDVLKIIRDKLRIKAKEKTLSQLIIGDTRDKVYDDTTIDTGEIETSNEIVLIVDDDRDTLYTVGEIIKDMGYQTEYAMNGIECLLSLEKIKPELILLDIMMPKMDGFETIKQIRRNDVYKNYKVIALTAHAMLDDKEIIEKNGFNGLVTKPINTKELEAKINQLIKKTIEK
jgi:signal transduction histidine kinase/CheY-like chemotaxis protein/HAMP domain-containing protein